jgi:curved DNA-binding protein CbpA
MAADGRDPYQTLGVRRDASDNEVRSAYRRLAQLHHPDHNGGSPEAARRFEAIQAAYARIRELRERAAPVADSPPAGGGRRFDAEAEARMADLERKVREAHLARERAMRAAREAAEPPPRPSDEELGYVHTDDSFTKILADARDEISQRFTEARTHPAAQRVADLIDELAAKISRDGTGRRDDD